MTQQERIETIWGLMETIKSLLNRLTEVMVEAVKNQQEEAKDDN